MRSAKRHRRCEDMVVIVVVRAQAPFRDVATTGPANEHPKFGCMSRWPGPGAYALRVTVLPGPRHDSCLYPLQPITTPDLSLFHAALTSITHLSPKRSRTSAARPALHPRKRKESCLALQREGREQGMVYDETDVQKYVLYR